MRSLAVLSPALALALLCCGGEEVPTGTNDTPTTKGRGGTGGRGGAAGAAGQSTAGNAGSNGGVGGSAGSAGGGGAGSGAAGIGGSSGSGTAGSGGSGTAGNGGGDTAGTGGSGTAGTGGSGTAGTGGSGTAGTGGSGTAGAGGSGTAGAGGTGAAGAGGTGAAGAGGTGAAGGSPVDVCAGSKHACPVPGALVEGKGLVDIDRCAFPIVEQGFDAYAALITATETKKLVKRVSVATVLGDLNRTAKAIAASAVPGKPAGVKHAFEWSAGDEDVAYWTPQGLTGSPDAVQSGVVNGRSVLLASWYYTLANDPGETQKKGVRVAFVDVTDPAKPTYRFALLVEPKGTAAAPDIAPVNVHAGGIVWLGDKLYVADTGNGFRVFDLAHLWDVAADAALGCDATRCTAAGYAYAIPQSGRYQSTDSCSLLFSWVSLDRSSSPATLVSGEYCSDAACAGPLAGRVLRWPLDAQGRLAAGTSYPSAAHVMQQKQVQGGTAYQGSFFFSSSAPAGGAGALYRVTKTKSKTYGWIDSPEDLLVDGPGNLLWSQSEALSARVVIGASLGSYPAP